jgi:cobalt-zinc-cadmium efflux system outer membrane protein
MLQGKASLILLSLCMLTAVRLTAQQTLTMEEVVRQAMDSSYQRMAAETQIRYDRLMEKKATHIPDPELILESPTGDFMTPGIQQSFEFPTVYIKQKQLAVQQTALSEKSKTLTEADYALKIKSAYLDWQYATAFAQQLKTQDSLYTILAEAASRQYLAGQIDFVEKTYAGLKYAEVHSRFLAARMEARKGMHQVQRYTGIPDSIQPTALEKGVNEFVLTTDAIDQTARDNAPVMAYYRQAEMVGQKAIELEKNKVLPDFTIGYLNQAGKDTPFGNRLRFGLSVPLWFWQYGTSVKAAETKLTMARQMTAAGMQELTQQWDSAKNDALIHQSTMNYYESEALPQATELTDAATRMFEAGQYDYIKYLTTLSDAFQIRQQYLELLRTYNKSLITLQYLTGQ